MPGIDFEELVKRAVESDELDYKAHQSWNSMSRVAKAKIVRHLAAFANTRGGYLVIGVGEDASGYPGVLQGLTDEESSSFDPSKVGAFVKNHIEPPIDFVIERPLIGGKRFAVFVVKPFTTMPHVCCQAVENELREGVFYIRTVDASSRPATRAMELHQLIQRALRNQREMLGRMLRGILYESNSSVAAVEPAGTVEQLRSAIEYFVRRRKPEETEKYALVQLTIVPDGNMDFSVESMKNALKSEPFTEMLNNISGKDKSQIYETSVGLRWLAEKSRRMWQFFQNGSFLYAEYIPVENGVVSIDRVSETVKNTITLAGALAEFFAQEERLYSVRLAVSGNGADKFELPDKRVLMSSANGTTSEICRSAADLASAPEVHAARIIRKFSAGLEENI